MMIGNDLQPNDGLLPPQREYQIHILTTVLSIAMTSRVCTDFSKPQPQFSLKELDILARFLDPIGSLVFVLLVSK